jgi:hypothetical protein
MSVRNPTRRARIFCCCPCRGVRAFIARRSLRQSRAYNCDGYRARAGSTRSALRLRLRRPAAREEGGAAPRDVKSRRSRPPRLASRFRLRRPGARRRGGSRPISTADVLARPGPGAHRTLREECFLHHGQVGFLTFYAASTLLTSGNVIAPILGTSEYSMQYRAEMQPERSAPLYAMMRYVPTRVASR